MIYITINYFTFTVRKHFQSRAPVGVTMEGTDDIKEELPPVDEDAEDVDMVMGTLSIEKIQQQSQNKKKKKKKKKKKPKDDS